MKSISPSMIVFLLVLHLLLCGAYGSRLGKFGRKLNEVEVSCKEYEDHCAPKGNIQRKLTTSTTLSTTTTQPLQANHVKNEEANRVELTKQKKNNITKRNDDSTDMTVMDYSPATRKSPIHN